MTIRNQDQAEDAALEVRALKIAAQFLAIEAMSDSNSKKFPATLRLNTLRYDQAVALMMQSMTRDGLINL